MALKSCGYLHLHLQSFVCSLVRWICNFIQLFLTCFLSSRHSVVGLSVIVSLETEQMRETLKHIHSDRYTQKALWRHRPAKTRALAATNRVTLTEPNPTLQSDCDLDPTHWKMLDTSRLTYTVLHTHTNNLIHSRTHTHTHKHTHTRIHSWTLLCRQIFN